MVGALSRAPAFWTLGKYKKYESVTACCTNVYDADHDSDIFQYPNFKDIFEAIRGDMYT